MPKAKSPLVVTKAFALMAYASLSARLQEPPDTRAYPKDADAARGFLSGLVAQFGDLESELVATREWPFDQGEFKTGDTE